MSGRGVAGVGAAVTFVAAGGAGAAAGLLASSPLWAGVALAATLLVGALATGATAWRATSADPPPVTDSTASGAAHHGSNTVGPVTAPGGTAVGVNYGTVGPGQPPAAS